MCASPSGRWHLRQRPALLFARGHRAIHRSGTDDPGARSFRCRGGSRFGGEASQGRRPGVHGTGNSRSEQPRDATGLYNLDPAVRFWATPPVHGCLRPTVVHPPRVHIQTARQCFLCEGAMVEPLAVGMHGANKARIRAGDVAVVLGCGPIGMVTALAALAGGCSRVFISDVQAAKLALAGKYPGITPVNAREQNLAALVREATDGWGARLSSRRAGTNGPRSRCSSRFAPAAAWCSSGFRGRRCPLTLWPRKPGRRGWRACSVTRHVFRGRWP